MYYNEMLYSRGSQSVGRDPPGGRKRFIGGAQDNFKNQHCIGRKKKL